MSQRNTYFQDEVVQRKIDIKQLGRTLKYILPFKKIFALVCFLMLISAGVSMIAPLLLRYIINNVVASKDYRQLTLIISGLAVLATAEIGINFTHQRLWVRWATM
jgi:ATP-binding cassette subfamily B protein